MQYFFAASSENGWCIRWTQRRCHFATFLERLRKISVNATWEQREYLRNEWIMSLGNVWCTVWSWDIRGSLRQRLCMSDFGPYCGFWISWKLALWCRICGRFCLWELLIIQWILFFHCYIIKTKKSSECKKKKEEEEKMDRKEMHSLKKLSWCAGCNRG